MKDPKEIAAGILARGKAQDGGVLCVGCHIGYMSPTCPTHGQMKEAHDKACREYTEKVMAYQSVTELCAAHGNLGEYITQLEKQRDEALANLAAAEARAEEYEKAQSMMDEAEWEALKVLRDAGVNSLVAAALPLADGIRQVVKERDSAVEVLRFIADQPCEQRAEGSSDEMNCTETGACITEFCLPCHARARLSATRAATKQGE